MNRPHIYLLKMASEGIRPQESYIANLSLYEREVLTKTESPKRKREWIYGRTLVKYGLYRHFGKKLLFWSEFCQQVTIVRDKNGFPSVMAPKSVGIDEKVSISISHKGDLISCALNLGVVGIDMEEKKQVITKRKACIFLQKDEVRAFNNLNEKEFNHRAIKSWTMKEAAMKCLRTDLKRLHGHNLSVEWLSKNEAEVTFNTETQSIKFKGQIINLGEKWLSVCSSGFVRTVSIRSVWVDLRKDLALF